MLALIDGDILLHEITNKIRTEVLDNNSEIIYAEADFARGMDLAHPTLPAEGCAEEARRQGDLA